MKVVKFQNIIYSWIIEGMTTLTSYGGNYSDSTSYQIYFYPLGGYQNNLICNWYFFAPNGYQSSSVFITMLISVNLDMYFYIQ